LKISILIPVYNEAPSISALINRVVTVNTHPIEKEIIIINDGSTDQLEEKLLPHTLNITHYLSYPKNMGKGHALRMGAEKATGDILLVQDADLEYYPDDYKKLIAPFSDENVDVVIGYRTLNNISKNYFFSPYFLGGRSINFFFNIISNRKIKDIHSGYKLIRKTHWDKLKLESNGFNFCHEFILKSTLNNFKIKEIPIKYFPRSFKDGKKIRMKDGFIAIKTMIIIYFKFKFS
jgi:dolichol-phosphate mannosyltransferase